MSKIMFMFPGQGAQFIGMGKAMYDKYEKAREIFDIASKATGLDIPALCFEENDKINITEYTQIAMLTVEAAIFAVMEEQGLKCDFTAGLSLGEYGALIAAGVLSYEDAFKVAYKQAEKEFENTRKQVTALEEEAVKALTGESRLDLAIVNQMLIKHRARLEKAQHTMDEARSRLESEKESAKETKAQIDELLSWADCYKRSDRDVRHMIISRLIERVEISKGYKMQIKFRISLNQFLGQEA